MTVRYPRPAILDSLQPGRHTVIEASAGTGKTFAIEHMVVELLLSRDVLLSQILVLTFTERAATELRKRIRATIEAILFNPYREFARDHDNPGRVWWIDDKARHRLNRALFSFDSASIGTIHGFFNRVLTEHAFDNCRLFDGTLEDGRALFGRAFKQALRKSIAHRPGDAASLLTLWLEQTGKDVDSLEDLLYTCHASRRIILPPFVIDAIRLEIATNPLFELDLKDEAERLQTVLKRAKVSGATVKAIGVRLAKLAGLIAHAGRTWEIALNADFQEAVTYTSSRISNLALTDKSASRLAEAITRLGDHVISLDAAMVQTCLPLVRKIHERRKTATGQFDYDDLIRDVSQALDSTRGPALVAAMRKAYQFALIDEFQDTDELQWSFFRRVFVESGSQNPVYLIGDPKQAIYGFRGADVITYQEACRLLGEAGSPQVTMSENFRSTAELIAACNHIFSHLAAQPFFTGKIQYNVPVRPGKELLALKADGSRATPIHLLKIEPRGDKLSIRELRRGLARQIAREIRALLSCADHALFYGPKGDTKRVELGEIFILTVTNRDAIEVSAALREANVPFAFYKQDGLFQTREAREVLDLLEAINNPADPGRRGRAWITPFFAVPLTALSSLVDPPESHPLVQQLTEWTDLAATRRFEMLFTRILDDSGIVRRELFLKDDERALTNYQHIFEILLEDARATGCELVDLIITLTAYIHGTRKPPGEEGNVQRLESDLKAVQIMTIHKSKGLEAAVVFLFGGFAAFVPDGLRRYHDQAGKRILYFGNHETAKLAAAKELEEEHERLYYVALTRAKARLYLPFIAPEHWDRQHWRGPYLHVNDRLADMMSHLPDSETAHLFRVDPFQDQPIKPDVETLDEAGVTLASWRPDAALLRERFQLREFSNIRNQHSGYEVTSYSRMKSPLAGGGELVPLGRVELDHEPVQASLAAVPSPGELPGGTATGLMLHEIFERIPFDSLIDATVFDTWRGLAQVTDVIDAAIAHNSINPAYRDVTATIVYRALTIKIPISNGRSIAGLAQCTRYQREMEFLFPFPEHGHPSLAQPEPGKTVIERGFIKGYIDLVAEYDGLIYFADWKSDVLSSYESELVKSHVNLHYDLQAKLYSLALVKALQIHSEAEYDGRFGGQIYIFLRGLCDGGGEHGLYFARPTWAEILAYEKTVQQHPGRGRGARS